MIDRLTPSERKAVIIRLYYCGELSFREAQEWFANDPTLRGA